MSQEQSCNWDGLSPVRRGMEAEQRNALLISLGNYTLSWMAASLKVLYTIPTHRCHFAHLTSINLLAEKLMSAIFLAS